MLAFNYAARTDLGLGAKSRNEDSAYASPDLLVLCDGMGGHAAGDVASSTVVGELVRRLDGEVDGVDDAADQLEAAILDANALLTEEMNASPDMDGMGTTCIAFLRVGNKLVQANVGDSRAFLLRGGRMTQITKDHSFVQTLLDEGRISEDEALHHPQRSLVTRVLTGRAEDHPDLSVREAQLGDRYLICSDGLSDYVARDTIEQILASDATPGQIADKLIQIALRASTRDNVTVVVAETVGDDAAAPTLPQVVGAAANRGTTTVPHQGNTPAEKAAALTRSAGATEPLATESTPTDAVSERDEQDVAPVLAEEEPGRKRPLRTIVLSLLTLLLLGAAAVGAYLWSQTQYYLGEKDGKVAVYRGLSEDLGPLPLSNVEEVTDIQLASLPEYQQTLVRDKTLDAGSRADIDRTVANLRSDDTSPMPPPEPIIAPTPSFDEQAQRAEEEARKREEEELRKRQSAGMTRAPRPVITSTTEPAA